MNNKLALVADSREWVVMHAACASVTPTRRYWYVADLVNPVKDLLDDRCAWCQFRLNERPDPHFEVQGVA